MTEHITEVDTYPTTTFYPLNYVSTVEEAMTAKFPDPDWFDYDSMHRKCLSHPNMAIIHAAARAERRVYFDGQSVL